MPNGIPRDGFFYRTLTHMIDSYDVASESWSDWVDDQADSIFLVLRSYAL